jgi:hypothetical protein
MFRERLQVIKNFAVRSEEFITHLTLPVDYFPRAFTITDACVTNADFVWFHKHFYL